MKKSLEKLLLIVFTLSVIMIPKTTAVAHEADGIYYVPSLVEYGIRDYRDIVLYYKLPNVEAKDTSIPSISKPVSNMVVTANNQTATDGQTIKSTIGQPITIDFSQSTSDDAPIADVGLQITNGTGDYTSCWRSLPNGSSGTSYGSTYSFSWGAASFTPDKAGTYTIYGEVRADIDKSEIYEHWDAWSDNGSHTIPDTVQAHTSYPDGPIQNYNVTWHFERITVIVSDKPEATTGLRVTPPTTYYIPSDQAIPSWLDSSLVTRDINQISHYVINECVAPTGYKITKYYVKRVFAPNKTGSGFFTDPDPSDGERIPDIDNMVTLYEGEVTNPDDFFKGWPSEKGVGWYGYFILGVEIDEI